MTALGDLTWPEVERLAADGAVLAVPLGSVVQHGPHLPLVTDTDIGAALAGRLAAARRDVIVAPPAGYGCSGEHAGFAGTISISQQALEAMLIELCRSAAATFRRILLISVHAGNDEPVIRAVRQLRGEHTDVIAWMPAADPSVVPAELITPAPEPAGSTDDDSPKPVMLPHQAARAAAGDLHAGRFETSLQLALDPRRVRLALAEAGNTKPLSELMPALRASGVRAVSPNGVLGDPSGASADEGDELLRSLDSQLLALVSRWMLAPPA